VRIPAHGDSRSFPHEESILRKLLALGFLAARPIHRTGNVQYLLKPACRVMPFSAAGAIDSRILPD
jgi:hypothetical protein